MTEPKKYRALTGLSYPVNEQEVLKRKRGEAARIKDVEAGDVVSDIPPMSLAWLLSGGFIEEVAE